MSTRRVAPPFSVPVPIIRIDPNAPTPGESLVGQPTVAPSDVRRRVARLLLLRTVVISIVLGLSMWLLGSGDQPMRGAVWLQSGIIAMTYLSSIGFGVALRMGVQPRNVARPMHAVDLVVTSLFVYVTGGAESPYTFLYALSIVSAGALSYRRGAVTITIATIVAVVTVSLLAWAHVFDWLPFTGRSVPWEQSGGDLARTLGIQLAALTGVGALSFIFGDQLQRGAETLATTRKAAAEVLTLHQNIVRSLSAGLITTAPDGTVLTANQAACDILGKPAPELTHKSLETAMPGLLAMIAESRELRRADLAVGALVLGVTVSPLRDLDDQVIGRVVNFQDLTELRRLESHMRRAERLATVGELAAGVAHEIRNPLASISGSIELLRAAPQVSEDDRTLMNIVHREIQRLNVLIGDLLDYANPRPSQPVELDLGVMVRETVQVARADQAFNDLELTCEVDAPLAITADSAKLRQVLWNLLRNAGDAAITGGKHVRVEARGAGIAVTISVVDDGPGIAKDKLARIFDPFFTTKQKGTGLGLATCHAIVTEHGGRIDVESDPGKGTKMVVRLPRTKLSSAT
ncbi:MAG: PAS domain-containing protein [Deltaproteobacteria bacterium]|nr:PAS domain-containing protein [Deltaproteobacteria bacterium]